MITRRILLLALLFVAVHGFNMDDICAKHKANGHCDNKKIAQNCAKQCGGGGGDEPTPEPEHPTDGPKPTSSPNKPTPSKNSRNNVEPKKNCDKLSPCIPISDANKNFKSRCEAVPPEQLNTGCHDHCNYDETTQQMKTAFLKGPCKLNQLRPYLTAASNGKDNSMCCQQKGLLDGKKTAVCGCFCNPTGPVWPGKGEAMKYAPCVGVLEGIMKCHSYAEGA